MAKEGINLSRLSGEGKRWSLLEKAWKRNPQLQSEKMSIFNDVIYHSGASTLTSISTKTSWLLWLSAMMKKLVAFGLGNDETAIAKVENGEIIKRLPGHSQQVKLLTFSRW